MSQSRLVLSGLLLPGLLLLTTLVSGCGEDSSSDSSPGTKSVKRSEEVTAKAKFFALYRDASRAKKNEDHEKAVKIYREALQLNPSHEGALVDLSHSLRILGRRAEALEVLEQLRRTHPLLPRPSFLLANLCADENATPAELERAAVLYQKVIDLEPNISGPRLALARVQRRLGRMKEAEASFTIALGTDPNSFDALTGLAELHLSANRHAKAIPLLVKALEVGTRAKGRRDVPSEMDTRDSFESGEIRSGRNRKVWLNLARAAHASGGYPTSVPKRFRHPDPASIR